METKTFMQSIKFGLKILRFLFGIFIFYGGFSWLVANRMEVSDKPLKDITIQEFLMVLWILLGVFITTTMLKGGNFTKQLDKTHFKKQK